MDPNDSYKYIFTRKILVQCQIRKIYISYFTYEYLLSYLFLSWQGKGAPNEMNTFSMKYLHYEPPYFYVINGENFPPK